MYRSLFDRQPSDTLVERPPMSADMSTVISLVGYRSTMDELPVAYRSSVGPVSVDSRARVDR